MKDRTLRNIYLCCYIALAFCIIWAASSVINFTNIMFGKYASSHPIDWSVNTTMRIIVFICYLLGSVAMVILCVKAVFNILKGLRQNTVFPRSNDKLMFWIALANFIQLFGAWNLQILWNDDEVLAITDKNIVTPFFLFFFAFMYKVAADAVEENNLTI